jgi:aerobic C4-dicarboxylate transport protein
VFLAQAVGIDLSIGQQLGLLAILLITSKGGAGVAGSAIVVLASTLAATGTIPVASVALILGVHRLLSSVFVPVNVLGNAVATLVIARMERAIDVSRFESELRRPVGAEVPVDAVELAPARHDERPAPAS